MKNKQYIPRVSETVNFQEEEEKILALWKEIDAFQTSLKQSKGKPRFSFYDGPPFATGLPHYGHILAGTIKDVITRYAHQQGFHVERRFGWDCHGLPVEFEIDKMLGIKGPEDVMKMGIKNYNAECRKIVSRYSNEWETTITRLGRWIDFKNDYKSMYPWFMESIWYMFKQLYNKGLVYQGNKIMPYSNTCNTPLSNFESGLNYKDVVDPAVTITLPILGDENNTSFLIWTTTPWTLPSNLAACVHPKLKYVKVKQISSKNYFIIMESRLPFIFQADDFEVIDSFLGETLKDKQYQPIFPYFEEMRELGAFRILCDEYVTSDAGTGIVHNAPYFGEDDYRVCLNNGVILKDMEPICPVDSSGHFTKSVTDFAGQYIKDADKQIITTLKSRGRLFHVTQVKHSYPFCWRSDTPLIYRSVPSWFIRVEHMQDELLKTVSETYWVPEFVKDKRFGNWLREARDWAVSRNRYWGTPIPIWMNSEGEIRCIGSVAELTKLTGKQVTDLHRENIDFLEIPSVVPGNPPLKRVPEVFDCWFESGCMPYAQQHYPFKNRKEFEEMFPADFIAEGIDQTRGWFYTLLVISTALFGKAPFKNLIVNGLVLASDGQKMSKRKKNYPDPMEVVNKFGADALRLYLISSPVVRAENLRFKEEGVRDVIKDVFLPWYNAFRFLFQNLELFVQNNSFNYEEKEVKSTNIMDRWILSFTQSLLKYVKKEMKLYHLFNVVPALTKYIDYLTNWYIRMNRKRLKGEEGVSDCQVALTTLFSVLFNIVSMMAPYAPFISEMMYQKIKIVTKSTIESIHYTMLPEPIELLINIDIERAVTRMQSVIELGRVLRDRKTVPVKYPLPEIIIVHQNQQYLDDIISLERYILSELNIRKISTTTDKSKFGISLRAEPDHKTLGLRLKGEFKKVAAAIKILTDSEINEMVNKGNRNIEGCDVDISEVRLIFKCENLNLSQYEINSDNDVLILVNFTRDSAMEEEGTAREIINRIQKLRKKAHLVPTDEISVFYETEKEIESVSIDYTEFIENTIKATYRPKSKKSIKDTLIIEETQSLKNCKLYLALSKLNNIKSPNVKWVNLQLVNLQPRFGNSDKAVLLLEVLGKKLNFKELKKNIVTLFGITSFSVWYKNKEITNDKVLNEVNGGIIFVTRNGKKPEIDNDIHIPFCKYHNFEKNGITGTLLLENPVGNIILQPSDYENMIQKWLSSK